MEKPPASIPEKLNLELSEVKDGWTRPYETWSCLLTLLSLLPTFLKAVSGKTVFLQLDSLNQTESY